MEFKVRVRNDFSDDGFVFQRGWGWGDWCVDVEIKAKPYHWSIKIASSFRDKECLVCHVLLHVKVVVRYVLPNKLRSLDDLSRL